MSEADWIPAMDAWMKRCLKAEAQRDALAEKLIDATQRLEDSNDILAKLIDAEAEIRRLRDDVGTQGGDK